MKKKNKNRIYYEEYEIRFRYKNEEGFWRNDGKEYVSVPLEGKFAKTEKDNHEEAERIFLNNRKDRKNIQITCVSYC